MPRLVSLRERMHEDITFGFYFTHEDISYGISWKQLKKWASLAGRGEKVDWGAVEDAAVGIQNDFVVQVARDRNKSVFVNIVLNIDLHEISGVPISTGRFRGLDEIFLQGDQTYIIMGFSTSCDERDLGLQVYSGDKGRGVLSIAAVRRAQGRTGIYRLEPKPADEALYKVGKENGNLYRLRDVNEGLYLIAKPIPIPARQAFSLKVLLTDAPPEEMTVVMGGLFTRDVI